MIYASNLLNAGARTILGLALGWILAVPNGASASEVIVPPAVNAVLPVGTASAAPFESPATLLKPTPSFTQAKAPVVPKFGAPSAEITFPANPTDNDIVLARAFAVSLAPLPGAPVPNENADLAKAILAFVKEHNSPRTLVEFLDQHPNSRWRPALLVNIGLVYEDQGAWSKTIPAWEEAWALTKTFDTFHLKAIADRSLGEMAIMHGRLGHYERLQTLFVECKDRDVRGPGAEYVREAQAGLRLMQNRPDEAFRCGPLALSKLYGALNPGKAIPTDLMNFKSTEKGTSLLEIKAFAEKIGLPCQLAYRNPGAVVLVPCIVNWKVHHFAAITGGQNGGYVSQDLTFGRDCFISPETLDSEASGYFVVRDGPLPVGWRSVSREEATKVYGRGSSGGPSGTGAGSCKNSQVGGGKGEGNNGAPQLSPAGGGAGPIPGRGPSGGGFGPGCPMTSYSFDTASISLVLKDTPVRYAPPVGQPVWFTATYNHRDITDRSNIGNLGDNWSFAWFSYIQAPSTSATTCYGPGNGQITFTGYNSSTGYFTPELMSQDILQLVSTNSYVLTHKDGSKEIYNLADTNTPARVFRTASVDRYGNQITFAYDSYYRMQTVTDAIGQVTVISYGLSTDPTNPSFYLITKVTDPFGRYASFQYNQTDQLISITDILGIVSSYTYGPSEFITSLTTPYGTTSFTGSDVPTTGTQYERWLEATDPLGASEKVEWTNNATNFQDVNSSGQANVAPSGFQNLYVNFRTTFYWNKKAMESDPNDFNSAAIYHFVHDPSDTSLMGFVLESYKEPLEQNRIWLAYPGQAATYYAGSTSQPSKVARVLDDGSEQDYSFQYNADDNVTQIVDPMGRETDISYYPNLIDVYQVTQKNGTGSDLLATYTYNSQHLPLSYTDAAGQTTTYTYNSFGELLTATNALSQTTTLTYNSDGYLQSVTGPIAGATTTLTYDGFGRVATVTGSDGYAVAIAYDAADRVVTVTYPDGTYNQVIYNNLDPEWNRDRLGRWSLTLYDPLRRMILERDPLLRETVYERCPCGALTGIVDPNGNQTIWTLDLQSRITKKTLPDGTFTTYNYENTTSRVKSVVDANGQTKTFSFNHDNTVSAVTYTGAINSTPNVTFAYDPVYPRIASMSDGTGTTSYAYNAITGSSSLGAGQLASVAGPISSSAVAYTYDALGRVLTNTVNGSANSTSFTYDSLGRVSLLVNPLGTFTPSYVGETGRVSSLSYPNSQVTNFSYYPNSSGGSTGNGDDRLETIANLNPSSTNISSFGYTYDSNGEIQSWSTQLDSSSSQTAYFQYDVAQQLTSALMPTTVGNPSQAFVYQYDSSGNRVQEQIDNSVTGSTYNYLNQLTAQGAGGTMQFTGTVSEPGTVTVGGNAGSVDSAGKWTASSSVTAGSNALALVATDLNGNVANKTIDVTVVGGASRTVTYDSNGNLLNNGAGQTYAWDAENRLVTVTQTSGTTGFVYNGLGQRVQETLNGTLIKQWIWGSGPQPIEERNASGTVTKRFYGSLGEQIGGTNYYFTTDHLGSVREMVDSSGATQARYAYDPYGRRTLVSGTDLADFGFTGDYYHAATGLSLTQFREYDANLGRWLSRDPLGEYAGINIYGYVLNDPINGIDPFGLCDGSGGGSGVFTSQYWQNAITNPFAPGSEIIAAIEGAGEGIRNTVSLTADGSLNVVPLLGGKRFGPGPFGGGLGGSAELSFDGLKLTPNLAGGKFGLNGAAGITFRLPLSGPQTYNFSIAGGDGPGGAFNISLGPNFIPTNLSLTVGVGFGREVSGNIPIPGGGGGSCK